MMGRKLKVGFVILLMVLSLVPVYTVSAKDTNTTDETEAGYIPANNTTAMNTTNPSVNATKVAAEVLLRNLERLQNYTSTLINETENVSAEILALYEKALNLTERAKALYNEGDYKESLHTSIMAMKTYKEVIRSIRLGTKPEQEMEMIRVRAEARRTLEYLKHVETFVRAAERRGVDVSNVTELINKTRLACTKILEANNTAAVNTTLLKQAEELRMKLENELRNIHMQFAVKSTKKVARAFDIRLEIMTKALERMKRVPGVNETVIETLTQELNQLRAKVNQLISEGKYLEALHLIKEATPKLMIGAIHLRWIQKDKMIYWPLGRPHCHPGRGMGHWGHRP